MLEYISRYKKLIAPLLVPVVGYFLKKYGLDIEFGMEQAHSLMDYTVYILTTVGVYKATNAPLPT